MRRRHAELILLFAGSCLLVKGGWNLANYAAFQSHPDWFIKAAQEAPSSTENVREMLPIALHPRNSLQDIAELHVLGKVEVPRLGMSVLVVEGDDDTKLGLAAGHVYGTAAFGQMGNSVIAGHRDTSFWPLRKIRIGDRVRVRAGRSYEYVVSSVRIVSPDDVSVLRGSATERVLTMVTCYPFHYFGRAPKRFIVQATIPRS